MVGSVDAVADAGAFHFRHEIVRDEDMVDAALTREAVDVFVVAGGGSGTRQMRCRGEAAVLPGELATKTRAHRQGRRSAPNVTKAGLR
jgi:hypothetical protein